ncbi:MAG: ABC transporter permease [Porticoccaceae bacterium]|jgi:putative ABC transport system permease protein|nr:ABC transporter permease [Porticoccaceae bacterium]
MFTRLATKSLLNRKGSVLLTIMAMSVSIFVLLGVEHIRDQSKQSFNSTVSGVDLIVGARTGSLNLLLYSVFRLGSPTSNIAWDSYQRVSSNPKVAWSIPISLGDSHRGFRVLGTTTDYFKYFNYGKKRRLEFSSGKPFEYTFDLVLGAQVAKKLGYSLGAQVVLAHGLGRASFSLHNKNPFTVVGILAPTGTPVDQTVHVSLQGVEAVHGGLQKPYVADDLPLVDFQGAELQPKSITAFMLGLTSRMATFGVRRDINNYRNEPLTAILPGVALSELWQMMSVIESTLRLISGLVLISALLGLSAMMLASIKEREKEIYLLRVIGAPPFYLFLLIELEALLISCISMFVGTITLYLSLLIARDGLATNFGLHIGVNVFSFNNVIFLVLVAGSTMVAAAIPSLMAFNDSSRRV